jgi:hypothetical protein
MDRKELIERLERGEVGNDLAVSISLVLFPAGHPDRDGVSYVRRAVQGSLDAAVALCERVRPGVWHVASAHLDDPAWAMLCPAGWDADVEARAPTPAAALVAALLRAEG